MDKIKNLFPEHDSTRCPVCHDFNCKTNPCKGLQAINALVNENNRLKESCERLKADLHDQKATARRDNHE